MSTETLPYWLKKLRDLRREWAGMRPLAEAEKLAETAYHDVTEAALQEYRRERDLALSKPTALFIHEVTAPLWAKYLAVEAEAKRKYLTAILDDQRRELLEEEL